MERIAGIRTRIVAVAKIWQTANPLIKKACQINLFIVFVNTIKLIGQLLGWQGVLAQVIWLGGTLIGISWGVLFAISLFRRIALRLYRLHRRQERQQIATNLTAIVEQLNTIEAVIQQEYKFAQAFDLDHRTTCETLFPRSIQALKQLKQTSTMTHRLLIQRTKQRRKARKRP